MTTTLYPHGVCVCVCVVCVPPALHSTHTLRLPLCAHVSLQTTGQNELSTNRLLTGYFVDNLLFIGIQQSKNKTKSKLKKSKPCWLFPSLCVCDGVGSAERRPHTMGLRSGARAPCKWEGKIPERVPSPRGNVYLFPHSSG